MYKERNIKFIGHVNIANWSLKAYTISENDLFKSLITYDEAKKNLPLWLEQLNSFEPNHENISFMILHEGKEGVFTLVNTWVGRNMLQTHIYLAKYESPDKFIKISGDGLFGCVWELEVINFEKEAWIKYVMKNNDKPDYKSYLNEILNTRY